MGEMKWGKQRSMHSTQLGVVMCVLGAYLAPTLYLQSAYSAMISLLCL